MTFKTHLKQLDYLASTGTNVLAVSKGKPAEAIRSLAKNGQVDFGESRLQEALAKIDILKDLPGLRWHFIGHLQANKVRGVVKNFDVIHSVHSLKLAERISRISVEEQKIPEVMCQVKFREDPSKTGFSVDHLLEVWNNLLVLPNIKITGLMTISPLEIDLVERKKLFQECRLLANKLSLPDCSMGMSHDWQEAVDAGATWVRLGTALFGERHK